MNDSSQLDIENTERITITDVVETYGAIRGEVLPFVGAIFSNLSGDKAKEDYDKREFIDINTENFDTQMKKIGPELKFELDNETIELKFDSLKDFEPLQVVKQVGSLKKLYELREYFEGILSKIDGNRELDKEFDDYFYDDNNLNTFNQYLNISSGSGDSDKKGAKKEPKEPDGAVKGQVIEEDSQSDTDDITSDTDEEYIKAEDQTKGSGDSDKKGAKKEPKEPKEPDGAVKGQVIEEDSQSDTDDITSDTNEEQIKAEDQTKNANEKVK